MPTKLKMPAAKRLLADIARYPTTAENYGEEPESQREKDFERLILRARKLLLRNEETR